MAIVCVKIGENEHPGYGKYKNISKHFDIVDVLPRHKTSMGVQAEKHYLAINVDTDGLTDAEFAAFRWKFKESWVDTTIELDSHEAGKHPVIEKRMYRLQNDGAKLNKLKINKAKQTKLTNAKTKKDDKQSFDITDDNKSKDKVDIMDFLQAVESKKENKTVYEELGLDKKTLKDAFKG